MTDVKRGENISLVKIAPHLNEIIVVVKWFKKLNDATEFDIDSSAFLLNEKNKVRNDADFVFYNQPKSLDNSIILKNRLFKVTLNNISADVYKISFVLTIYNAKQKQQSFGMLEKISVELFDLENKQKLVSYILDDAESETAIILAQLYRYHTAWKFKAIGQGYMDGLDVLAKNYGVDVESDSSESQQTKQIESDSSDLDFPDFETDNNDKPKQSNPEKINTKKSETENLLNKSTNNDFDIHNTDFMTKEEHYEPIVQWFKNRNFVTEVNPEAMDTSGFFDEVAIELGDDYQLLKIVSNTIKRRQMDKRTAYINFGNYNYSPQQTEAIKKFCKQLYKYSFVAKYLYNSEENKIILHLQSAIKIVDFFNGEWLEWYAFMKIAKFCYEREIKFACSRNIIISVPDERKYELDVFCLIDGKPLFIECKSGEYRGFIDKYSQLRKKMQMAKPYFWFLISGASDEQVKGLTAMFDITFINEKMLDDYCEDVFGDAKAFQ